MKTARRMEHIPFSGIRRVFEEIGRREKSGEKIIHLEIGRPDFDTPAHIKSAAKQALDNNTPHNPTGAVYDQKSLESLALFAGNNDLFVLSDEIYEKLIFDGHRHISFATLPNMRERTITINGLSKLYAMTGWRLGYAAAPKMLAEAMVRVHQYTTVCAVTFAQSGGYAALSGSQEEAKNMVSAFEKRRRLVCERLEAMPGIELVKPSGAFYALPSVQGLGMSAKACADYLLDNAKIAVVPGDAFGEFAQGTIRISYANFYEQLEKAMDQMQTALEALS
ncbi:MAG: aminotransferase class I/II-fold pyridoxal phosphate-dependent enzyme [Desulfohalobiaceae bacterium]|nr:aminotransferase class I/II-fold pyridoxal phosphate-dependent enzyme [Desulfohalobiaceae bacterium]